VGRRADVAVTRFALAQGRRSVVSCWALMLVMAAVGHMHLAWMAGLTAFILFEERTLVGREPLWPAAGGLAFAAVAVALGG
jgi:predicted metal-binding membrane protein